MKGHAFIKDGSDVAETEFDVKAKSFKHDGHKYNVRGSGLFYWRKGWLRMRLAAFYQMGKPNPLTLDEKMPIVTAEELKIMSEERVTQRGFRSLRTPFALPSRAMLFIFIAAAVIGGIIWYTTMGPGAGGETENIIRGVLP